MKDKSPKARTTFWLHAIFVMVAHLSPLLFSWWLIVAGATAVLAQFAIVGGCVLTKVQFKGKEKSFLSYYIKKAGFNISERKIRLFATVIDPVLLILLALLLQEVLGVKPFFS